MRFNFVESQGIQHSEGRIQKLQKGGASPQAGRRRPSALVLTAAGGWKESARGRAQSKMGDGARLIL
jgi:hypothetical protein